MRHFWRRTLMGSIKFQNSNFLNSMGIKFEFDHDDNHYFNHNLEFGFLISNEFDTLIEILNIFEGLKNFPFEFGSLSAALKYILNSCYRIGIFSCIFKYLSVTTGQFQRTRLWFLPVVFSIWPQWFWLWKLTKSHIRFWLSLTKTQNQLNKHSESNTKMNSGKTQLGYNLPQSNMSMTKQIFKRNPLRNDIKDLGLPVKLLKSHVNDQKWGNDFKC